MKKTYFIALFNIGKHTSLNSIIFQAISWCLFYITSLLLELNLTIFSSIAQYIKLIGLIFFIISPILFVFFLAILVIESFERLIYDSWLNMIRSIIQTFQLRSFLIQREHTERYISMDNQTVLSYNPINRSFNRAIKKSVVDIRKNEIRVFIKLPRTQQGQEVLRKMEAHIMEEISNLNPNYYFSKPNRIKRTLWINGQKR